MSERPKCPKCGGELPADAPGDLCPNCLLATGLKSQSADDPYAEYLASTTPQGDDSEGISPSAQLEPGQQFGGYRIIRRLGRGGMGSVYEAEDLESHRRVALKILGHSFDSPDARKRFLREGRLAASINHPNGMVKVGDFGLSISTAPRGESNVTIEGTFLGTPAYASPEQLRGDELDIRSDVYSVGVTLYYLLTGRAPFENKNLVQFLATALERPAPSPRTIRGAIPKELARIVLRCLEKQPASRYGSYDELRRALLPYSSTAPTAGTLGLRFLASITDTLIWSLVILTFSFAWFRDPSAIMLPDLADFEHVMTLAAVNSLLYMLYFAVFDGVWGATPGKALFRLRVVDSSKSAPGIPRAFARALIWVMVPQTIYMVYVICTRPQFAGGEVSWLTQVMSLTYYMMLGVLFSTARFLKLSASIACGLRPTTVRSSLTLMRRGSSVWPNRSHPVWKPMEASFQRDGSSTRLPSPPWKVGALLLKKRMSSGLPFRYLSTLAPCSMGCPSVRGRPCQRPRSSPCCKRLLTFRECDAWDWSWDPSLFPC